VNLADLKKQVRKIIGDRLAGDQVFTQDVYITSVLNEASIPELVGAHDWTWKEHVQTAPLGTGTFKIQMPSQIKDVRLAILMTGARGTTRPLDHKFPANFFTFWPDPSLEPPNYPDCYTWANREIWFNCPTAASYSLRIVGLLKPDSLVDDADSPDFLDSDRHMLLAYHASGFIFSVMEDSKNSLIWSKLYEAGLENFWQEHNKQSDRTVTLGRYTPGQDPSYSTEYWRDANVRYAPDGS